MKKITLHSDYLELKGDIYTAKQWNQKTVNFQGNEMTLAEAETLAKTYKGAKTVFGKIPANVSYQGFKGH